MWIFHNVLENGKDLLKKKGHEQRSSFNKSEYLACRYRWTRQCGPSKLHHSGRALKGIHWCQSHSVVQHIPDHTDTGKSPPCSHISQNAHMGLHLLVKAEEQYMKCTHCNMWHKVNDYSIKKMLGKWCLTNWTFIHVLIAGTSHKTSRTGTNGTAIKRVGVTYCTLVAWITHTCIIKVTQQTCANII